MACPGHCFRLAITSWKLPTTRSEVTKAVNKVKKVSNSLTQSAELLPEPKKQEVKQQLEQAEAELTQTTKKILASEDYNQAK